MDNAIDGTAVSHTHMRSCMHRSSPVSILLLFLFYSCPFPQGGRTGSFLFDVIHSSVLLLRAQFADLGRHPFSVVGRELKDNGSSRGGCIKLSSGLFTLDCTGVCVYVYLCVRVRVCISVCTTLRACVGDLLLPACCREGGGKGGAAEHTTGRQLSYCWLAGIALPCRHLVLGS